VYSKRDDPHFQGKNITENLYKNRLYFNRFVVKIEKLNKKLANTSDTNFQINPGLLNIFGSL
jgi:hypothetical protein